MLEEDTLLQLVVFIANEDGVSISEVLERGLFDLKLRVALMELRNKKKE